MAIDRMKTKRNSWLALALCALCACSDSVDAALTADLPFPKEPFQIKGRAFYLMTRSAADFNSAKASAVGR